MPADRPRTPNHRKAIALGSLAAFVLIIVAGKIASFTAPNAGADTPIAMDGVAYTPLVDTHLNGLVIQRPRFAEAQFVRFTPDAAAPWHAHSRSYVGILVSGVMKDPFSAGDEASTIGPGTYWYVPAGAKHAVACVSEKPCLAYLRFGSREPTAPAATAAPR